MERQGYNTMLMIVIIINIDLRVDATFTGAKRTTAVFVHQTDKALIDEHLAAAMELIGLGTFFR